ncbi:hypothetical protein LMG28614_07036 [Paraburkholderia ultramafica]|uniref:Uncharacterized protein n=1 Tax=Paraburkholderia ultramafica TaxID=1544867 RepID=A0A6S7DIQ3_9BURK|nr:hypothetical protein [Paraburkholderia ultramafica]CAB3809452.1 hypothetical protein LMG28614_07036 [Paraburkholderia ultramafica]
MNIDASKRHLRTTWEQGALRFLRNVSLRFQVRGMIADRKAFAGTLAPVEEANVAIIPGKGGYPDGQQIPGQNLAFPQVVTLREDGAREIISALLGCWPEPSLAVAKRVGVAKIELDSYLAGQTTLSDAAMSRLMAVFGLTSVHRERLTGAKRPVTTVEPYVLLAGNAPERVSTVHDFLVGEDPIRSSVELVPAGRAPGHCWRYQLIMRHADIPSLICFPRIGRSARILDEGQLPQFRGQLAVGPAFYHAVEAMRADVEQRPTRVLEAMRALYRTWAADIGQIGVRLHRIGMKV